MKKNELYNIIDIHTHILSGVDDGSHSIEETINLIKEAKNVGVNEIILTPHYYNGLYYKDKIIILDKYNEILKILKEMQIDIKIYIGNEIYMTPDINKEIINNDILTLGNSKYVLLETSFDIKQLYLESEFRKIIEHGYKPIFAHVERYGFVQKNIQELDTFINMGVEIQCNYGSILGLYGTKAKKTVYKLLKQKKVTYMASDAHREKTIYNYLPIILKKLYKLIPNEYFEKITYLNAKKII